MQRSIELIGDESGVLLLGDSAEIDRFLASTELAELPAHDVDLRGVSSALSSVPASPLSPLSQSTRQQGALAGVLSSAALPAEVLQAGSAVAQTGSTIAEQSGRWVQLTAESAEAVKRFGLMPTASPGVSHAMIGSPGEVQRWLQIAHGPASIVTNPVALASVAGLLSQQAMQQQMDRIIEYLAVIDEKVDEILRAQTDAVVADMIGVDLMIAEALEVRKQTGRVSATTWSKVQSCPSTVARTQAYAVRRLDAVAERLDKLADVGDLARGIREAAPQVREWLAVLARCVQLQEGLAILELGHVSETSLEDLDDHRSALHASRAHRLALLSESTTRLLERMQTTALAANDRVLLNPFDSPAAVKSSRQVSDDLLEFRERVGITSEFEAHDAKRWSQAVREVRDRAIAIGTQGVGAVKRTGDTAVDRATGVFRSVDLDGDGVPDPSRAATAVAQAGGAVTGAVKGAASGAAEKLGGALRRVRPGARAAGAASVDPELDELDELADDASDEVGASAGTDAASTSEEPE